MHGHLKIARWVDLRGPSDGMEFQIMLEQFQNTYPIRNLTLNNFALRDRFNIPDGSRGMRKSL